MTLMDAPKYTAPIHKHLGLKVSGTIVGLIAVCVFLFVFWNWPSEHRVHRFLDAVQAHAYPEAFGIWNDDPQWQQHPQQYANATYGYKQFLQDWGPGGSEGTPKTYKLLHATSKVGNTVLVAVEINGRTDPLLTLSVSKKNHTLGFSPFDLSPVSTTLGWTRWGISFHN